jgi:putative transcriptional regulator
MPAARKYLKGQLLLDSGQLSGSFFQRKVVLVCQHDAEGAFGLVLNYLSGASVGDVLVADLPERIKAAPLHIGGPVQPTALSYLLQGENIGEAEVLPNLSLGHSLDALDNDEKTDALADRIKLFAGYSGWSAGQLEDEIERKAWIIHPASIELVFNKEPLGLWQIVLKKKGWKYKILSQMPEDLSYN